jgi:hypothetical protein
MADPYSRIVAPSTYGVINDHNLIYNTAEFYPVDDNHDYGTNAIKANPRLINPPSGFGLQAGSPAVDAGSSSYGAAFDFVGASRPQGAGYDIGAYEYQTTPEPPTGSPTNAIFFSGAEMGTLGEWYASSGAVSVDSTIKKTGGYSLRFNPNGATGYVYNSAYCSGISFWLYIASAVSGADIKIATFSSEAPASMYLYLTQDNYIDLYANGGVKVKDGTTQLATGTWYRISASASKTSKCVKYYINGIQEATIYTTLNTIYDGVTFLGVWGNGVGADIFFDDIVTTGADSTDDMRDIR